MDGSDKLLDIHDSNIPGEQLHQDEATKIQTEFKNRIQIARQEIQTKFVGFFDELKQEETRLLDKLNEIENEAIKDFELFSKTLIEITQARENTLATLKSNTTSTLLKNTLDMYDKEIETIKNKSKINSITVELKWSEFQFTNLCEILIPILQELPAVPPIPQPMRTNEADIPSLALREQQANANVNVSTNSDPFQHQVFYNIRQQSDNEGPNVTFPPPMQNYSVNPNRDPYGPNILSQYQSAMTYQTNIERQIGNHPERRQISGQQQQQQPQPQQPQQQPQQQQQQPHSQWQCPHCTSYNSTKYTFCEVCYKSPGFKPDFSDIPRSQSSKQCPYCTHANLMRDVNCAKCGNSMIQQN